MKTKIKLFVALIVLLSGAGVRIVGADPTGTCPDGMVPVLAVTSTDMSKDHNGNGLVCKKVDNQGQFVGGPDDTVDDLIA